MLITDSQIHIWEAHRPDRPWPAETAGKPAFVPKPGGRPHRSEPLGAQECLAIMDAAGVQRAILVPPWPVGEANLTVLEAAANHPERLAAMGRFNPEADGARELLEGWLSQPGMLGIRMTFHKPTWSRWLDDADSVPWFWSDCERLGIPLMMLTPGRLDKVERIAQRHPELTLIIDHMARRSGERDDACFADLDVLLNIARYPNISVKTSAVPCFTNQTYPFANLTPYLHRIYEAFGPQRTMWGSDLTRLHCSYQECVDHFRVELDFLDEVGRAWILGRAVSEILGWPEGTSTPVR